MWAIKVLTGPQAGQVFELKNGANVLGRAPSCQIKILSPNVSKEHVKIEVFDGRILASDMGSRNGTFLNGTQIRSSLIKPGDRLGLHEIIIEFGPLANYQNTFVRTGVTRATQNAIQGNLAYQTEPLDPSPEVAPPQAPEPLKAAYAYLERVVLPGVYRLGEAMEFKWLLGLFMAAFIVLVTSLSTIPLIRILRDSVETQSQQHALTIAATLARVNEAVVRDGLFTAINMSTANRLGVSKALIIQAMDGKILAPASQAESFPDIPFVHEARKLNKESVRQIDSNTVVAVYPIEAYNPETGSRGVLAYSVVVYDMTSLAVDDSKTISLFITTLFIALILGSVLFFLLHRLIEYPIHSLNRQLDTALKENRDDLKTDFLFPPLQRLTSNINSALSRAARGGESPVVRTLEYDRRLEMNHLVEMVGFAALVISAHDRLVAAVNQGFEDRTRLDPNRILNHPVGDIPDQALKLSLLDILGRLEKLPDEVASNELEFGGQNYQILAQTIYGTSTIAYFLVILVPGGEE